MKSTITPKIQVTDKDCAVKKKEKGEEENN